MIKSGVFLIIRKTYKKASWCEKCFRNERWLKQGTVRFIRPQKSISRSSALGQLIPAELKWLCSSQIPWLSLAAANSALGFPRQHQRGFVVLSMFKSSGLGWVWSSQCSSCWAGSREGWMGAGLCVWNEAYCWERNETLNKQWPSTSLPWLQDLIFAALK